MGRENQLTVKGGFSCKAIITVEAALIMPIVIFTVFAIIYLTFYLHDICRLQGMVDETLHKAAYDLKYEADPASFGLDYESIIKHGIFEPSPTERRDYEQKLQNYLWQNLAKGLFLSQVTDIRAAVGVGSLKIAVHTRSRVNLPWIKRLFEGYSKTMIAGEHPIHDPARTIRICEIILDTADKVKGVDELKNKLERFHPKNIGN